MTEQNAAIDSVLAELGLTVESVFVPFSQSRNKAEKHKGLNWKVTVKRNGRDVLTTDYGAGIGHCPGYKANTVPTGFRAPDRFRKCGTPYPGTSSAYRRATPAEALGDYRAAICAAECESGVAMEFDYSPAAGSDFKPRRVRAPGATSSKPVPIMPEPRDVIYSLVMDSSVLDSGCFEQWAAEFGYDTDSRAAESIYRACLEIALKMRAALGDDGMCKLQETFQDY